MLRVANVYADKLDLSEIHDTTLDCGELERVKLQTGDLLVVEGNGSIDKIGRVAIWDGSIQECVHQNHLIKLRFADQILGRYCLHWMLSISGRECIERVASSSSGLHTLSISKLASLPIPIAGSSELLENVRLAEDRLAEASRMQFALKSNDKSATGLRQSVLRTAFEGKLAPQDPNDEPASVLLDRIRNAAHSAKSKITKRGK
jgi:type I restriction enzyme S subunit